MLALVATAAALSWTPAGGIGLRSCALATTQRRLAVAPSLVAERSSGVVAEGIAMGAVVATAPPAPKVRQQSNESSVARPGSALNRNLTKLDDAEEVLRLVDTEYSTMTIENLATALHRCSIINKRQRAGRDAMLRDRRFDKLVDGLVDRSSELTAKNVADVLWSAATLQHLPATMLMPVLTAVNAQLDKGTFKAHHLATVVWAFGKLAIKPVKLLERIEEQAAPKLGELNMQNAANMMWGCAMLNYVPPTLLPAMSSTLLAKGEMLASAKPVEVAHMAFALGKLGASGGYVEVFVELSRRAAPETALSTFSSRQLVMLIGACSALQAAEALPAGLLDAWVATIRSAHELTPLLIADARSLEASITAMGVEATWIKRAEILNAWIDAHLNEQGAKRQSMAEYSDADLREAFNSIDVDLSGDIDLDELRSAIRSIRKTLDEQTVEKMMQLADADDSGSVDFDEFKELMQGSFRRGFLV